MQKKDQNPKYLMSNGLLSLGDKFYHPCKIHGYGLLSYNVLILCV